MSKFCRKCGATLKPQAKFCGGCGTAVSGESTPVHPQQSPQNVVVPGGSGTLDNTNALNASIARNSHLIWNLEQGQVAQKLPPSWMDYYDTARGLIIHPGTMGLFFVNGKFHTRIESGEYVFDQYAASKDTPPGGNAPGVGEATATAASDVAQATKGAVSSAIQGVAGAIVGGCRWVANLFGGGRKVSGEKAQTIGESNPQITQVVQQEILQATRAKNAVQVVLVKGAGFPVVAQLSDVKTASIHTPVGIELFVYIKDADAFYTKFMIDRTLVTAEQIRDDLNPIIQQELANCLVNVKAEEIKNNGNLLTDLQNRLQTQVQNHLPYLGVQRVVQVSSDNQDLQRLQQLNDELYISELELEQLVNRNEFKNRLRLEENKQKIRSSSQENALESEMLNLNKDKLLNEADFQKHVMFVRNDLRISAAKTEDEYTSALSEIEKSGVLRDEELSLLHDQVEFNRETKQEGYRSSLDLQHISSRIESAKAELRFEREVGDDQLALETERSRKALLQDWDETNITLEIQKQKAQAKAGLATAEVEARKIWDEYDREAEKQRREDELDLQKQEDSLEIDKLKALQEVKQAKDDGEHKRDMEAVKFASEAEVKKLETEAQRWKGMSAEQILAANPDISDAAANAFAAKYSGEKAEEAAEEKKQMVDDMMDRNERMMKEMMGTVAQVASGQNTQKDKEIDRAHQTAQSQIEAVTQAVGAGAAAVGEGMKGGTTRANKQATKTCPACNATNGADSAYCESCGASI